MRTVDDYLQDVIPRVYMPLMAELLTQEELTSMTLSIRESPETSPRSGDIPIGQNLSILCIEIVDEAFYQWLFEPMTDHELTDRFYSELQDWISETTFGWGQLRGRIWRAT